MNIQLRPYSSPEALTSVRPHEDHQYTPSKSLYISHFLSTWNSRGFEFGAVLFLATIYPNTLMPMSIYALVRAAAAIFVSPWVGRYIDSTRRLRVVRVSIVGQRLSVILSCLGFLFLLSRPDQVFTTTSHAIFLGLVCLACVEKLSAVMNTVAVERDWVVVIADGRDDLLQEINSQMRRIDLFCKLVSPLATAILDGVSSNIAVLATLLINAVIVGAEYLLIARVYHKTPALASQTLSTSVAALADRHMSDDDLNLQRLSTDSNASNVDGTWSPSSERPAARVSIIRTANEYVSSAAFLPSLSLSILYLTVLSFAGQMTTFLLAVPSPRFTSLIVGILRTVSTVFELSSTFIAPKVMSSIGAVRAGIWFLSWQVLCLTIGVTFLWFATIPHTSLPAVITERASPFTDSVSIVTFIATIILSRVGLWSFDLVAQIHIQSSIEPAQRGSFSSVEASLQNFFELCTFASTIIWSKPEQFRYPALVSLGATYIAACCYAKFVRNERGHLLHLPQCFENFKLRPREAGDATYRTVSDQEEGDDER